jgi:magnesium transporter
MSDGPTYRASSNNPGRDQLSMRPRRSSTIQIAFGQPTYESPNSYRPSYINPFVSHDSASHRHNGNNNNRPRTADSGHNGNVDEEEDVADERAPLIASSSRSKSSNHVLGYGSYGGDPKNRHGSSRSSSRSKKKTIFDKQSSLALPTDNYNVNYPPSMPGSPELGAVNRGMSFGDVLVRDEFAPARASPCGHDSNDFAIDVDEQTERNSMPGSPRKDSGFEGRRHTIAIGAEEDVCFPVEGMSEMADDDMPQRDGSAYRRGGHDPRRRRGKLWPDLAMLDDWSSYEKEGRSEGRRAKRMVEPQLIGGRLRPIHKGWHRAEDDAPYRFTYFNEEFQSTIHSQTISELVQPGSSFKELFIPDPTELESSSGESEGEEPTHTEASYLRHATGQNGDSRTPTQHSSLLDRQEWTRVQSVTSEGVQYDSKSTSGDASPNGGKSPKMEKPKRYGDRPTWWLDVLSPTDAEMKVLSKTFGIHPLTAEDIMMQEAREKVELFRNYYFVNYRSFEQDMNNEDFLEPVNMYVVVFREGVISFHFSMTPHPANVRRRIRQLKDYLILSSDWISYAIIDDITDVFVPLIQSIEDEVDDIDDAILKLHSPGSDDKDKISKDNEKRSEAGDGTSGESGGDMLRRVGDCRKKVMGLYRLLGNKADVIKGFAKRCNEHWEVAPRSEIGLYLGDIQDHIVTMTGNLSHYEK